MELWHFLIQGSVGKLVNLLGRGDATSVDLQNAYEALRRLVLRQPARDTSIEIKIAPPLPEITRPIPYQ